MLAALATVDDPEIHKPITELGMVKGVTILPDGVAAVGCSSPGPLSDARHDHQRVTEASRRCRDQRRAVELDVMSDEQAHRAARACAATRPTR